MLIVVHSFLRFHQCRIDVSNELLFVLCFQRIVMQWTPQCSMLLDMLFGKGRAGDFLRQRKEGRASLLTV